MNTHPNDRANAPVNQTTSNPMTPAPQNPGAVDPTLAALRERYNHRVAANATQAPTQAPAGSLANLQAQPERLRAATALLELAGAPSPQTYLDIAGEHLREARALLELSRSQSQVTRGASGHEDAVMHFNDEEYAAAAILRDMRGADMAQTDDEDADRTISAPSLGDFDEDGTVTAPSVDGHGENAPANSHQASGAPESAKGSSSLSSLKSTGDDSGKSMGMDRQDQESDDGPPPEILPFPDASDDSNYEPEPKRRKTSQRGQSRKQRATTRSRQRVVESSSPTPPPRQQRAARRSRQYVVESSPSTSSLSPPPRPQPATRRSRQRVVESSSPTPPPQPRRNLRARGPNNQVMPPPPSLQASSSPPSLSPTPPLQAPPTLPDPDAAGFMPSAANEFSFEYDSPSGRSAAELNALFNPPARPKRTAQEKEADADAQKSFRQLNTRPRAGLADDLVKGMERKAERERRKMARDGDDDSESDGDVEME